jgi:hypothetical protein
MFLKRQRARRLRRRQRSAGTMPGLDDWTDLDEMIGAVCDWAVSLPWVVDRTLTDAPSPHQFVIDCPVLSCRQPWFAVDATSDELQDGPELIVVLPNSIAHRGGLNGLAVRTVQVDGCRSIAAVAVPSNARELCAVQALLTATYSGTFPS